MKPAEAFFFSFYKNTSIYNRLGERAAAASRRGFSYPFYLQNSTIYITMAVLPTLYWYQEGGVHNISIFYNLYYSKYNRLLYLQMARWR